MSSSGFRRLEVPGAVIVVSDSYAAEIEALALAEPGALEHWRDGARVVPGGRARGWRIELSSGRVVHLREMAHGGLLRHLTGRRFLDLQRAIAGLEVAATLSARGVSVPAPVLMHARRRGPFWQIALANEYIEGSVSGGRFLAGAAGPPGPRVGIAAARRAGARVRAFHDAGGSHPDLHLDNLLVTRVADQPDAMIIDLDGVTVGAPPSAARRMKELMRLHRSLAKHGTPTAAARRWSAAFFKGYVADDAALRAALLAQPGSAARSQRHTRGDPPRRAHPGDPGADDAGPPA